MSDSLTEKLRATTLRFVVPSSGDMGFAWTYADTQKNSDGGSGPEDWKKALKLPAKDTRHQTEVRACVPSAAVELG
jgi:hypothetical protein